MKSRPVALSVTLIGLAVTTLAVTGSGAVQARPPGVPTGDVVIVQALPGEPLDISIDGHVMSSDAAVGAVLGPYSLPEGDHRVQFTDASGSVRLASMVTVAAGSRGDVVVHRPAQVGGPAVVNVYRTPEAAIAPGKARVLVAHTATVAPADVRVDGTVVFTNIANGEYATADVAAGTHTVALLPTGLTTHPILGPLQLTLEPGTVTMVYAVGSPRDHSMNVIVHRATLTSNGATAPSAIDTGTAGLASGIAVTPFRIGASADRRSAPAARQPTGPPAR